MNDLFIIDINAIIHRCYHAVTELTTTKGVPVNAVYGTCSTLSRIFQKFQIKNCLIAWDSPGESERRKQYPAYKENRKEKDPELACQYPYVARLVRALGLHSFYFDGWEADDVIGTLVKRYTSDYRIYIVSGDKDLTQLVTDRVFMYDFGKDITYDIDAVITKFGVKPSQIQEYLSLVGDTSDNVPGVKGVGPKKAVALLQEYGTLENIYLNVARIKGKLGENLQLYRQDMADSFDLVGLRCRLDLPTPISVAGPRPDLQKLAEFFQELDFREPENRFPGLYGVDPSQEEGQVMF